VHPGSRIEAQGRHLGQLALRMRACARHALEASRFRLGELSAGLRRGRPDLEGRLARHRADEQRLGMAFARDMRDRASRLERAGASLALLDPAAVLQRGYSIVTTECGAIVRQAKVLSPGQKLRLAFGEGEATARVEDVTKNEA
jgi:exodeoxyribonuclease VII large subunit